MFKPLEQILEDSSVELKVVIHSICFIVVPLLLRIHCEQAIQFCLFRALRAHRTLTVLGILCTALWFSKSHRNLVNYYIVGKNSNFGSYLGLGACPRDYDIT